MGKIIPSPLQENELAPFSLEGKFNHIATTYLDKDSSRSEQVNTANAVIAVNLAMISQKKPDLRSYEECVNAIARYFEITASKNVRPSISGIALTFGLTRTEFLNVCENGMITPKYNPIPIALPNAVWELFTTLRDNYTAMIESFMEANLIHPSSGIFLLKNNSDYKDVVERRVSIAQAVVDVNALAEKYSQELEAE